MIFQTAFVLLETNSGQRFSKIEQYSVEYGPSAPPHPTPLPAPLHHHKNFEKFKLHNHICYTDKIYRKYVS